MNGEYGDKPREVRIVEVKDALEELFFECVLEDLDEDDASALGFCFSKGDAVQNLLIELIALDAENFIKNVEEALQNSAAGKGLTHLISSWALRRIGPSSGKPKRPELN